MAPYFGDNHGQSNACATLKDVVRRIRQVEERFGRVPGSVKLLAVTKTRTPAEILTAAAAGQRCFGENYLQEALPKIETLADPALEWHFIGRVQANKTEPIARHFSWVHTVDREKLARRLSEQRPAELAALNVCVQINISGEPTKSGIVLDELPGLLGSISAYPRLRLRGLMCLPAPCTDFDRQRLCFRCLASALADMRDRGFDLDTLSMGTSDDLEAAIAEGATMVRIGSAIFGPRTPPRSQ